MKETSYVTASALTTSPLLRVVIFVTLKKKTLQKSCSAIKNLLNI